MFACHQAWRWDVPLDCDGLREVEALVIEKEIGLPAENLFRDNRPANGRAVTAVMEAGKWSEPAAEIVIVILPALRRPVVVLVILVTRAVPGSWFRAW